MVSRGCREIEKRLIKSRDSDGREGDKEECAKWKRWEGFRKSTKGYLDVVDVAKMLLKRRERKKKQRGMWKWRQRRNEVIWKIVVLIITGWLGIQ